jgi:FdhE protein
VTDVAPWTRHRERAQHLGERFDFATEVMTLYSALTDVWDAASTLVFERRPAHLVEWVAENVVPDVVKATEAAGPDPLGLACRELYQSGQVEESLRTWLAGGDLEPVERYVARASLAAPLFALGADAGAECAADPAPRDERRCPRCGGPPQVSYRSGSDDPLVSGGRSLLCARCGHPWSYSASACASCGETQGSKRTVYSEEHPGPIVAGNRGDTTFPHLRIEACATCQRYLIDVDLNRDALAVPDVDELAALPLDLYAADLGLRKITPNLVGF